MSPPADNPSAMRTAAWLPVRPLTAEHRSDIAAHLRALSPHDRYLRFGSAAGDEQIEGYVASIDFDHDEVLGIFNRRLELVAAAHLAFERDGGGERRTSAELGLSTIDGARRRGFASRLFRQVMLIARNRGVDTLVIHALSENAPMLRIASQAGATLQLDGTDAVASLRLPPDTLGTRIDELFDSTAAELDYRIKAHNRLPDGGTSAVVELD